MKGILFLADPNSIHDIKWMSYFSNNFPCYLLARKPHLENWLEADRSRFKKQFNIEILGSINDFSIRRFYSNTKQWEQIHNYLERLQISLFHIMYAEPNALWAVYKSKTRNVGWILTTRGTDVLKTIPVHYAKKDPLNRVIKYFYRKALSEFDQITCTSGEQFTSIRALSENKNIHIVRTGVDIERIVNSAGHSVPTELIGKKYVLFPRNMRPLYNHEFSIKAIDALPSAIKQRWSFVFVDSDSTVVEYVVFIKALIDSCTDVNIIFLKRQSQEGIWKLYKNASLVVMNPVSDGTPVSAMEAIVCGIPVILGPFKYDKEIFGKRVFQIQSWSVTELTNLMCDILLGNGCGQLIEGGEIDYSIFDRQYQMKRLLDIYLKTIKELH